MAHDLNGLIVLSTSQATSFISDLVESSVKRALERHVVTSTKEPELPAMLTRQQTSDFLGVTLATLNNWSKSTDERLAILVPQKVGTRVRYRREDVLAVFKETRRHKTTPA